MAMPLILPPGTLLPDPALYPVGMCLFRMAPPGDAESYVRDWAGGVPCWRKRVRACPPASP